MDGDGGAVVEIACDESGFSGTNLLDAATPVFTHASVDLCVDDAVQLIRSLRGLMVVSTTTASRRPRRRLPPSLRPVRGSGVTCAAMRPAPLG